MQVLFGDTLMGMEAEIPALRQRFPDVDFRHAETRDAARRMIAEADVYLGSLDREMFLDAKRLKWIQSPSSGVNYYTAIPELVEGEVLLTSASGTHAVCVAESAIAMILAHTRGITESQEYRRSRQWAFRQIRPRLVELTGSTVGIVGLGNIGRAVARRLHAFEARIVAVDLSAERPPYVEEVRPLDRLHDLLRESDYVVITVPFTEKTEGLIGDREIRQMKPTAMLVGISRGGIIDQDALLAALREGRLAAAALDVFNPEPLPEDSPLWDESRLIMTPHIAGGTQLERHAILEIFTENLSRFVAGDLPLRNQADKPRGF